MNKLIDKNNIILIDDVKYEIIDIIKVMITNRIMFQY